MKCVCRHAWTAMLSPSSTRYMQAGQSCLRQICASSQGGQPLPALCHGEAAVLLDSGITAMYCRCM